MEGKIRIEVLFPEIANLYGDLENIEYLKKSYPEVEVVETHLTGEPEFMKETPSLIYMGTLTENGQRLAVEKLSYAEKETDAPDKLKLFDDDNVFVLYGTDSIALGMKVADRVLDMMKKSAADEKGGEE